MFYPDVGTEGSVRMTGRAYFKAYLKTINDHLIKKLGTINVVVALILVVVRFIAEIGGFLARVARRGDWSAVGLLHLRINCRYDQYAPLAVGDQR